MHGLIAAPSDPASLPAWRECLRQWREASRTLMGYSGEIYSKPEFQWIQRTFTLGFVMMCDALFYRDGDYDLDGYLAYGEREFGGFDALIFWHAYPRIGVDDRNQYDFYRQMPDGLPRLRALVDACHARGVRVYIDYNPWDTGTRREDISDVDALADLVVELDADAVFLDTMSNAAAGLRTLLDAARRGVSLESEVLVPLEHLETHPSSWAQSLTDVPGVLRNKWFERRHMHHRIRRWQADHSPELHTAWMNGTGMVVWENVFGTPVHWCERDKSILRGMIRVQRRYYALFCGEDWTPLVPTLDTRIQASLWSDDTQRLWTLANTSAETVSGSVLRAAHHEHDRYFDLIRGDELHPQFIGDAFVSLTIRARGVGAILATSDVTDELRAFLANQRAIDERADWEAMPPVVAQRPVQQPIGTPFAHTRREGVTEMVRFDTAEFDMKTTFTVRECGLYDIPGVEFPSLRYVNLHRPFSVTRRVAVGAFAIDAAPVTNAQFAAFLRDSGYRPAIPFNFLAHWGSGEIPAGQEDHPVVWVDLADARAYAAWAGKRLPTDREWQYAAGGAAGRPWPWGHDRPNRDQCNYGQFGGTTPVRQFPRGATPDGIFDLCGNVWEWTESETTDGRTRFAILKGGSWYKAHGSEWYADGGAQPNDFVAKFLLMYPGLDRCATIGFRCAASRSAYEPRPLIY